MSIKRVGPTREFKINRKIIKFFNRNFVKKGFIKGDVSWEHEGKRYEVTFKRIDD